MKKLFYSLILFYSFASFADGLNLPTTISTNGTGQVELIIIADGKDGQCFIEVGQDNTLIYSHKLLMKPHGLMVDTVTIREGKAELYIHCKQSTFVYFNILASTKSLTGWNTKEINKELFKTQDNDPVNLAGHEVFHRMLSIIK